MNPVSTTILETQIGAGFLGADDPECLIIEIADDVKKVETLESFFAELQQSLQGKAIRQIALNAPNFATVRVLLQWPPLIGSGALTIEMDPHCGNALGPKLAEAVALAPCVASLHKLSLASQEIATKGAKALAASSFFTNLQSLDLTYNEIQPKGIKALVESPAFPSLVELDLAGNFIDDVAVKAILSSPLVARLKRICLPDDITDETLDRLHERLGDRLDF